VGPSSLCTALPQFALGGKRPSVTEVNWTSDKWWSSSLGVGSELTTFHNKIGHSTKCYTWPHIGQILTPYARRKAEILKEIDYLLNLILDGTIMLS
jgi:hypothetical protein